MTLILNLPAIGVQYTERYVKNFQKVYQKYGVTKKTLSVTLTETNNYQYVESRSNLSKDWPPSHYLNIKSFSWSFCSLKLQSFIR